MSTITAEQEQAIRDLVDGMELPSGLGTKKAACSIAVINLALTGVLTDAIPECMSPVIGRWIIRIQDAMPADMRNSPEWKRVLPLAAGTGRTHEQERHDLIMTWMWEDVLPLVQPLADARGFGAEWSHMLTKRTRAAATAATYAAYATGAYATAYANAAANAAYATGADAEAAYATGADAAAAAAAATYAATGADATTWRQFNPPALLNRLIAVSA